MHPDVPPLTREESLYLDGALPAAAARALEERLAADPALRSRLEAWRARMDLWRDDVARRAASMEPDALLRGALDASRRGAAAEAAAAGAARRYAVAAAALLALGMGGTAWLSLLPTPDASDSAVRAVERERIELQGTFELLALPVAPPAAKGG